MPDYFSILKSKHPQRHAPENSIRFSTLMWTGDESGEDGRLKKKKKREKTYKRNI